MASKDAPRLVTGVLFLIGVVIWLFVMVQTRKGAYSGWVITIVLGLTLLGTMALVPGSSTDVNSYAMYGHMVADLDASPYALAPIDFPGDRWAERVARFWADSPSVYGPVFTALSAGVMTIAGDSFTIARLGFQLLALVGYLLIVAMLWRRSRRLDVVMFFAANPIAIAFGVNDSHCDMLVGAALLGSYLALEKKRWFLVGLLIAVAVMVKISALPVVAGAVVWLWFNRERTGAVIVGLTSVVFSAVGFASVGASDVLAALKVAAERQTRFSAWAPLHGFLDGPLDVGAVTSQQVCSLLANMSIAVLGLFLIWKFRTKPVAVLSMVSGLVIYQLLGNYSLSWYLLWAMPMLAFVWRSPMAWLPVAQAVWVSIAFFSGYLGIVVLVAMLAFVIYDRRHQWRVLGKYSNEFQAPLPSARVET